MAELMQDEQIIEVLRGARTIALLGAHEHPAKPAFYVPDYLHMQGYRILPVNPMLVGKTLWGEPVRASLAELAEPVDIVDVFRRPDLLFGHMEDLAAMRPKPRLVWLQLGIRNDAFARAVLELGIDVVQDRCTLADHRRFAIPPLQGA
ncbi:MAG: CoA-binding protein [Polyangiaceae bacterium]